MTESEPLRLPVAYTLHRVQERVDPRQYVCQQARAGAEDASVYFFEQPSDLLGRRGKQWFADAKDCQFGVVLHPDVELDDYHEIFLVAALSVGSALARHLSAMTSLRYGWPNDIYIGALKLASLWFDHGVDAATEKPWLSIVVSINMIDNACAEEVSSITIKEAEGTVGFTREQILQSFAGDFIRYLNLWHEQGIELPLQQWSGRMDGFGEEFIYDEEQNGEPDVLLELNERGDALLQSADGEGILSIYDYMMQ